MICCNIFVAQNFLDNLEKEGKKSPEDIYIAAFGTVASAASRSSCITSVVLDLVKLGCSAVELYLSLLRNGTTGVSINAKVSCSFASATANDNIRLSNANSEFSNYPGYHINSSLASAHRIERLIKSCSPADTEILRFRPPVIKTRFRSA